MRPSNAPGPGEAIPMRVIAHIHNDFPTKFGIPRQSGLADTLLSQIIFTPPYRRPEALRGLSDFSHLWLLWQFSEAVRADWSPTVRPPRLGGNRRMGVFATRSPFRPNPIGLSAVRLLQVSEVTPAGPVLTVAGADLMDGTPILDIKPYLAYADAIPDAAGGFAEAVPRTPLAVDFPPALLEKIPPEKQAGLLAVLAGDPRPAYQADPARVYGFRFGGWEIKFTVAGTRLAVASVEPA